MNMSDISAGQQIFKRFDDTEVRIADAEKRIVRFTITTSDVDREGDIILTSGIDTANFEKNPVVLFGHNYKDLPVGRCVGMEKLANRIVASVEFATEDMNPKAEQVYRMVRAGFLKATSIGFQPLEWEPTPSGKGIVFTRCELLEFSVVPIPAQPQALIAAGARGIDTAVLREWANDTLRALDDEVVLYLKADAPLTTSDLWPNRVVDARTLLTKFLASLGDAADAAKYDPLRDAIDSITEFLESLGKSRSARRRRDEPVLRLADDAPATFTVDTADVRAAVRMALTQTIADATKAAINHARGRVIE